MTVFFWILIILTAGGLGYVGYGTYLWFSAHDDPELREKAKNHLLIGAIVVVVLIIAWIIFALLAHRSKPAANQNNANIQKGTLSTKGGSFSLTGVTSCAARPNYADNVSRASAIVLTFNADIRAETVAAAVSGTTSGTPKLLVEQCDDQNCLKPTTPKPIADQTYSGNTAQGATGQTKSEWVVRNNTIAFYHASFSADEKSADNRWFAPEAWYRVTIPKGTASTALQDLRHRALARCQKTSGEGIEGDHCTEKDDRLWWTFKTGTTANSTALAIRQTVPSSQYVADATNVPDQTLSRTPIIGFDLNAAIDPASLTASTFSIAKINGDVDAQTGKGGQLNAQPIAADQYTVRVNGTGTGAWWQLKDGKFLDPFSWYRVTVAGVRSLCGTGDSVTQTWVFKTTDVVPGVLQAYPKNGYQYACATTKAFVQFTTSMWKISDGSDDCAPGSAGSYVVDGALSKADNRTLSVADQFNPNDPNHSCTIYAFGPERQSLTVQSTYHGGLNTTRHDLDGTVINFGDTPPAKTPSAGPWSFSVAPPATCIQPPIITSIAPAQGAGGRCLTVLGDYFEKKTATGFETDGQNAGDTLALGPTTQSAFAWMNNAITTRLATTGLTTGQVAKYKVTVNYPSPVGPQVSNEMGFQVLPGDDSLKPCLKSLSPTTGPQNSRLSAAGDHFGPYLNTSSAILTNQCGTNWDVDGAKWSDTAIGPDAITVQPKAPAGQCLVQVRDDKGNASNPVPFIVNTPGGTSTIPQVVESTLCNVQSNTVPSPNPVRDDNRACLNTQITARFTIPINRQTINGSTVYLEQCADNAACTAVPTTVAAYSQSFTLRPLSRLLPNTRYRVTITHRVMSSAGVAMTVPYTWSFSTVSSAADCAITGVAIAEPGRLFKSAYKYPLHAVVTDTSCHTLDPSNLVYAWSSSNTAVATLITGATGMDNVATGPKQSSDVGDASITVNTQNKTSAPIVLSYQPTRCSTAQDCARNSLGESCPGSSCKNNVCTPVVNKIDPSSGAPGTWTTIQGCWFGGYVDGKSKVQMADGKAAVAVDPGLCGNTWTNERIIREIPASTVNGALTITRSDGQQAKTGTYTINGTSHPSICKVKPESGKNSEAVTITGHGYGTAAGSADTVTFTKSGTTVKATSILDWSANTIDTVIASQAVPGNNEIRVQKGTVASNAWTLAVLDQNSQNPDNPTSGNDNGNTNGNTNGGNGNGNTNGETPCTTADCPPPCGSDCAPPPNGCTICSATSNTCGANQGCGYNYCCGARPVITNVTPPKGQTNLCRNLSFRISFDQPLDSGTVNNSTVRFEQNGQVQANVSSTDNGLDTGAVVIQPGTLLANAAQKITLSPDIKSSTGVPVLLRTGDSPMSFSTGAALCSIQRVVVTPDDADSIFTQPSQSHGYTAQALNADGSVILRTPDFSWTWSWLSSDPTVVSLASTDTDTMKVTAASPPKNGTAAITATATVTKGSTKTVVSGSADATVDLCANPWEYTIPTYHIRLHYCAAKNTYLCTAGTCAGGPNDRQSCTSSAQCSDPAALPTLTLPPVVGTKIETTEPAGMKTIIQYFFKYPAAPSDVIGLRIQENTAKLSPADWVAKRFPTVTNGQSTTIGGYPAVHIGTTTYVGFADADAAGVHTYMLVLDYNSNNAQSPTAAVFTELVNKLSFNTSMSNEARSALQRDTVRLGNLSAIQNALQTYRQANGTYPNLQSGSYIVGFSTSAWPSWQGLGNSLGAALPTDPVNTLSKCVNDPVKNTAYDTTTCWSESKKNFQCLPGGSIYGYKSDGKTYHLYANFDTPSLRNTFPDPCSGMNGSVCTCFTYDSYTNH